MMEAVIKHVLAGGQEAEDIRGHRVALTEATGAAYQILLAILNRQQEQERPGGRCTA